jgi:hypothetical protein
MRLLVVRMAVLDGPGCGSGASVRGWSGRLWRSVRPDLGHDVRVVGVGVEDFSDDLVRDEQAVEVAGVDVGDP